MFDPDRKFRRANHWLLALVILEVAYLLGVPAAPVVVAWGNHFSGESDHLQGLLDNDAVASQLPNQLIAPDIALDAEIQQDSSANATMPVAPGIWLWTSGSTPDKGGNVVLLGQRFTYRQPNGAFYRLGSLPDKAKLGLVWNHKMYHYTVMSTAVVSTNDTASLAPTDKPTLTLLTSNPQLWPSGWLVVTAQATEATP